MATGKLALKLRSVTYPTYQNKSRNDKQRRNQLQRMNSFDYSDDASLILREDCRRRDMSAEGRSRTSFFQSSHSISTDTATGSFTPLHHRSSRHSSDTCCSFLEYEDISNGPSDRRGLTTMGSQRSWMSSDYLSHNTERLIDWRRMSPERKYVGRNHSYSMMQRHGRSPEKRSSDNYYCVRRRRLCTSTSVPPPVSKSPLEKQPSSSAEGTPKSSKIVSSEGNRRRMQFRRALSLFSLSCNGKEGERDQKSPQKKILRPPTRHVYRRGLSGLPIECSSKNLGLVY